jgi:ABC-2 type transport system ATP-binding protein
VTAGGAASVPVIEARNLTKRFRVALKAPGLTGAIKHLARPRYQEKIAVDGIDLVISAGESVGYIGPNGAGKSTTLKLLSGILVPSAGEVWVRGLVPHRQRSENARNIGVVFGQRTQLWWDLPVQESLRLLGDIYSVPAKIFERNLREFVDLLDLGPLLPIPARQLSLGQRMRCDLAASLIHSPPVLFLDEPTIGLDVAVKARMRDFIKRIIRESEVTVLLTSHDLGDIEDLCERIVMIDRGTIVFDGPLRAIKERFGRERVIHLILRDPLPTAVDLARSELPELPASAFTQTEPHQLTVRFDPTRATPGAIAGRLLALLPVDDLRVEETSVESIVRQLYDGKLQFNPSVE